MVLNVLYGDFNNLLCYNSYTRQVPVICGCHNLPSVIMCIKSGGLQW